ncbi:hypothetical protein [Rhodococcus marinonascens]|uniref:hypothetical protein n=1 Tax=Rhodococcus marinonascens TaxID=38311 RepID=UPI000AC304DF|nr:hypothetical protein [Rhodococcus marinonascens]
MGDEGSDLSIERGKIPNFVGRSVLDRDLEVRILASHHTLDGSREFPGPYPPGAVMVSTSVKGRHARTGSVVEVNPVEADAWGLAMAPEGFEEFGVILGTPSYFSTGARHYRFVLDAAGGMCAIPATDCEILVAGMR